MKRIHRYYCRYRRWDSPLRALLPWATADVGVDGARVLELGSGPGKTSEWLVSQAQHVIAVEIDASDASELATRLAGAEVIKADATDLPLADASFDDVVSFPMLHHLASAAPQDQLFAESLRVLRPRRRVRRK